MKRRLCYALLCAAVAVVLWVWGAFNDRRYRDRLFGTGDMFAALMYYLEAHEGEFPASPDDLLSLESVAYDGKVWRVRRCPDSGFDHLIGQVYEWPIRDIGRYRIRWGSDMAKLQLGADGVLREGNGNEVLLLTGGSFHPAYIERDRQWSRVLYEAWRSLHESPQSPRAGEPASAPASES